MVSTTLWVRNTWPAACRLSSVDRMAGLVLLTALGQHHASIPAIEQRHLKRRLQLADVPADSRLGCVQLFGSVSDATKPGCGFERDQRADGRNVESCAVHGSSSGYPGTSGDRLPETLAGSGPRKPHDGAWRTGRVGECLRDDMDAYCLPLDGESLQIHHARAGCSIRSGRFLTRMNTETEPRLRDWRCHGTTHRSRLPAGLRLLAICTGPTNM